MKGRTLGGLVCCCVLGQLAGVSVARAEENRDQGTMDEVVVTATKTPKTLAEVPADVTIVTKEELKKKNYVNVNEALESVSGVMSYAQGGFAPSPPSSPVVNLRGFHGAQRTMIMVNGQPLSPFLYVSLVHWSAIPVDAIERIEVVKGPFSALYGGDAVAGLINIITKTPEKFETTVRSGYGSFDTFKEHVSVGDKLFNKLSLFAAYDYKTTDNYIAKYNILKPSTAGSATPVTGASPEPYRTGGTGYVVGDKGKYDYDEHTFTFNSKLDLTPSSSLKTNVLYSFYKAEPFGSSSYLRDANGNEIRTGKVVLPGNVYLDLTSGSFLAARSERATGVYSMEYVNAINDALKVKVSGGLTDFDTDKYMSPGSSATEKGGPGTYQEAPSRIWTGELQTDYRVAKWLLLTGGFNYRRDEGKYSRYSASDWRDYNSITTLSQTITPESNRYGVYLQAEVNPFDKLAVYLGLRYDSWSSSATRHTPTLTEKLKADSKDSVSPKISFVYTPWNSTILRLSGGKAFRVPNFFEMYQPLTTTGTTYVPNPNLKPETTWAWEAGVEQELFNGWTHLNFTFFQSFTKNYIGSRVYTSGGVTYAERDNFGKVQIDGFEVEVRQKITDYLNGFVNYTYQNSRIKEYTYNPKYVGNQVGYVPQDMLNLGLDLKYKPFSASLVTHYRSRMQGSNADDTVNYGVYGVQDEIPFVTDLTVGYDFLKNYNFTFSVKNLFDSRYFTDDLAPGRTFFGMLSAKF